LAEENRRSQPKDLEVCSRGHTSGRPLGPADTVLRRGKRGYRKTV